jgi:hypothetical protein
MGKDRNLEHGEPPCTKDNPDYCKVSEDTARAIFGSKQQIQMLRAVKAVAKQIKDDDAVEKLEESIKLLESLEWTYIRLDHLQWDVREDRQLEKATKKIAEQEADGHPDVIRELMRAIHERSRR